MEKKNRIKIFLDFLASFLKFILGNRFIQILIIMFLLYFYQIQILKHSKFGVFINCKDEVVHDNRDFRGNKTEATDLLSSKDNELKKNKN